MAPWLENFLLSSVDGLYRCLPQKTPSREKLEQVRLVSHRGERDNRQVFENTFEAFDPILENNIWGIEFDIRWTRDLVPVVIHDPDGQRVFNNPFVVAEHDWQQCQTHLPKVPSLESLLERYGGKLHLMIELKQEYYPDPEKQKAILQELLSGLKPVEDFHVIALDCELFRHVDFLPAEALLPVSTTNAASLSNYALDNKLGGLTGHYLFMSQAILEKHHTKGQRVGSGFANSRKVLKRETNRNMDWVFSNHALAMHHHILAMLRDQ